MRKHKMNRRSSRKVFRKTALKTKKVNVVRPMRGGFAL